MKYIISSPGVSAPGASVLGYDLPPIEFSTLSYYIEYNNNLLYTRSFCPIGMASPLVLAMHVVNLRSFCTRSFCPRIWSPPHRIFYTVIYILLRSFCTRSFCPRVWPPPYRISTLSSIEYIISSQEFLLLS